MAGKKKPKIAATVTKKGEYVLYKYILAFS